MLKGIFRKEEKIKASEILIITAFLFFAAFAIISKASSITAIYRYIF